MATWATLAISGNSVLATGNQTNGDLYSITMNGLSLAGVTGFKLNIGLGPNNAIGFSDFSNGNAVLAEFQVSTNAAAVLRPRFVKPRLRGWGETGSTLQSEASKVAFMVQGFTPVPVAMAGRAGV